MTTLFSLRQHSIRRALAAVLALLAMAAALGTAGCGKTAPAAPRSSTPAAITADKPVQVPERNNLISFSRQEVFSVHQVITADSTTSRTIQWQSEREEKDPFVEYRELGPDGKPTGALWAQGAWRNEQFKEDGKTSWIHTVRLTELRPGTSYQYRLGFDGERGPWLSLKTPSGPSFRALIFTDSQSSDYDVWGKVADSAWSRNGNADLFLLLGDLVDNGQQDAQWRQWFRQAGTMVTAIPVATVMGNHETYTVDWKVRMPEAYLHLFQLPPLPESLQKKYGNQFYSFDFGDVHFTVLNTQFRELDQFEPRLREDQMAWLRQDLQQTRKKWKIVLLHKDVLQYGFKHRTTPRAEGFSEEGRLFMPVFDEFHVDAVLSGHLHSYRNRGHIRNFQRNAEGPLYLMAGLSGNVRYPDLWRNHALDMKVLPQPETDNYMTLDASPDRLRFRTYLPDGTQVDDVTLTKD
jgi:acid phosphatase type 7